MEISELKIKVGLDVIIKNDIPGKEKRCPCKILGWDTGKIIILKLIENLDQQFSSKGTPLTVGFLDEGIVYGFKSKLISIVELLESHFLMLQFPEKLEKIQLRKEKRFRVNFKGSFKSVLTNGSIDQTQLQDCNIIDLSANGCGIFSKYQIQTERKISLSFQVPLQGKIKDLLGIVVNEFKLPDGEFKYGIKFDEDTKQRSIISSYLSVVGILHESSI